MPKESQVNIRFDEDTDADLREAAARLGVSKSALVRHLTSTFLAEVKRTGTVPLQPNWVGLMEKADARSEGGERKHPKKKVSYAAKKPPRKK